MLCCALALAACGGGGGDDGATNSNNTVNQAPSNVAFNSVTALNATTIEAIWSLAKDDKTIASTMRYQVHLSESANFTPSSTTLKFEQRGALTTQLSSLKASTTYFVKLVVIDEDNAQTISAEKSVTTPAIAVTNQAPTNVALSSVAAASQTAVDVVWTATNDDTTPANQLTYEVHLAEGGDFSPTASTLKFSGKNVLSTQLTGLKAATSYSVKLVVVDAQGAKTVSTVKSVTTSNTTAQNTAPTNVKIYAVNPATRPSAIDIWWYVATDDTSAVNQITYEVHVAEGGDFTPSAATLKDSAYYDQPINQPIAVQVPDLKMGVLYTVKLVAIDVQGLKTVSSGVTVTPQNSSFNTSPTNVVLGVLKATSPTTADVSWSAAQDDYTNVSELLYEVHLAEGGDFSPTASTLKFSGKNALNTQLTGLKAATAYSVKLVAIDAQNMRTTSSAKSLVTPPSTVSNQAPTNVALSSIVAASQTAVDVSWTAANDDTTPANQLTYEVHLAEGGDFSPTASTLKFSSKNALNTQLTGLKAATAYSVKLVVVDAQGAKTVSAVKSASTLSDTVLAAGLLNDTGITQCVNQNNVMGNCGKAHLGDWFGYNQDAQIGRDALAAKGQLTKVGGGDAGFDFSKISATGQKLPANETTWSCVLDNHTGLMWENKTDDGGLHDKDNTYTWYSTNASNNGGDVGSYNNGQNTSDFVTAVNAQGWCGHKDWRLPNVTELQSIVHYGRSSPAIDEAYFSYTRNNYWSSSPVAANSGNAWVVSYVMPNLYNINHYSKGSNYYVRLVRSSQ